MMNWLSNLFGRGPSSAQIAKSRLKLVLSYDRTNITPEMLSMLQDEIVRAISQHLDVDRSAITISTQRSDNGDHLVADIPIRSVRHGGDDSRQSTREPVDARAPARSSNPAPSYKKKKDRKRR